MAERLNMAREVAALKRMTVKELRGRYVEVFGEATRSGNKDWLWKRIAWRIQANAEGGLTERARRRAEELADDADLRMRRPPDKPAPSPDATTTKTKVDFSGAAGELMPGTVLTRAYKGKTITVTVRDDGFVAKAVTGSHWNGNYFFGVKGRRAG